jgi:hypothetical protein
MMSFSEVPMFTDTEALYLCRKVAASRGGRASKGGGRRKIPDHELTDAQRKRRERDARRKKRTEL